MQFYKSCAKWAAEVDDNPEALKEQRLFEGSEQFQSMLRAVSKRLGFEATLEFKDVELMYLACSFETAWNPEQLSPWCSPFSEEDLKVLEYHQDLDYYWIDGYGYELTYKQACAPVQDVVKNFQ
jgi:multiple inositol-polyphosphate phosphatase/2,3-bisphosphoglycerate 3-phosphatase